MGGLAKSSYLLLLLLAVIMIQCLYGAFQLFKILHLYHLIYPYDIPVREAKWLSPCCWCGLEASTIVAWLRPPEMFVVEWGHLLAALCYIRSYAFKLTWYEDRHWNQCHPRATNRTIGVALDDYQDRKLYRWSRAQLSLLLPFVAAPQPPKHLFQRTASGSDNSGLWEGGCCQNHARLLFARAETPAIVQVLFSIYHLVGAILWLCF